MISFFSYLSTEVVYSYVYCAIFSLHRVYNKTEFGDVVEGDDVIFYDNPAAECKRMSYVMEVYNGNIVFTHLSAYKALSFCANLAT